MVASTRAEAGAATRNGTERVAEREPRSASGRSGSFVERALDDVLEPRRDRGTLEPDRSRRCGEARDRGADVGVGPERRVAGEHLVEHEAE